jgi:hypothetical protein
MTKLPRWKIGMIVITVAVVIAGIFVVAIPRLRGISGPDPLAPGAALWSIDFPDGTRLLIHGLGEDEWQDGIMAAPSEGWRLRTSNLTKEAFGYDKEGLQIERFTLDDRLAGVRYMAGPGRLVISMRYLDPSGRAVAPDHLKPGDLAIRLSDGGGVWIEGDGPHGAVEDAWSRGMVSFAGWPRGGRELVFQAVRAGLAPVEFRLPNPDAGSSPAAWRALPLPQLQKGDGWEVRMVKAREITTKNKGRALVADFEFQSDLKKDSRGNPPIDGWLHAVHGSRGTRSEWALRFRGRHEMLSAFPMPPDEDVFKFIYRIAYRENYPFPRSGVSIIAKGSVSADGKTIDVSPRDGFPGVAKIELGPVKPAEDSWYPAADEFSLSFAGALKDASEKSAAHAKAGAWKDWSPVVILDGGETTSGVVSLISSSNSDGAAENRFEWSGRWAGNLKPGMTVEIGVMARKPDEMLEFTVDRASLSRD